MAIFTVHMRGDGPEAARGVVLVPEGFSSGAFVFGPLWLLRHRLWLATALWIVVAIALGAATSVLTAGASACLGLLLAVVTGTEAQAWRRRSLVRRGFGLKDIVSAADLEAAEHRFFSRPEPARVAEPDVAPAAPRPSASMTPRPAPVLGLFPEAEGGR